MSKRYRDAREAFEFLETVAELTDQVDLDAERLTLMRKPTYDVAAGLYESGIRLWIAEHGEHVMFNDRVDEIMAIYG